MMPIAQSLATTKLLKGFRRRLMMSGDLSEEAITKNLRVLLEEEWGYERGLTIFARYSELQAHKGDRAKDGNIE
jgi:hypothetical protein